jgi:hypothetical protein
VKEREQRPRVSVSHSKAHLQWTNFLPLNPTFSRPLPKYCHRLTPKPSTQGPLGNIQDPNNDKILPFPINIFFSSGLWSGTKLSCDEVTHGEKNKLSFRCCNLLHIHYFLKFSWQIT